MKTQSGFKFKTRFTAVRLTYSYSLFYDAKNITTDVNVRFNLIDNNLTTLGEKNSEMRLKRKC